MQSIQLKSILLSSLLGCMIIISGCNSENQEAMIDNENNANQLKEDAFKDQNVFYSIPSPVEVAQLLKKAGAKYDKSCLNSPKNVSKYNTTTSRALNLGVYGSDLSFASIFEQTQDAMLSLKAANTLANLIGINGAFGAETIARMEANMDNLDSLLDIISEAFWTADSYLKENNLPNTSALVLAGGWVEGLYIATTIGSATNDPEIINRIVEQKISLRSLINLLESYGKDESTESILNDLKSLKAIYDDGTEYTRTKIEAKTDKETQITTIGGNSKTAISDIKLKELTSKVQSIRNSITQ